MSHTKAEFIQVETALDGIGIDLHPGAEKYFSEAGVLENGGLNLVNRRPAVILSVGTCGRSFYFFMLTGNAQLVRYGISLGGHVGIIL